MNHGAHDHAVPADAAFRAWLEDANLDIKDVAERLGVSASLASRFGRTVNGKRWFPTDGQKFQIARMSGGRVMPNDWYSNLPEPDPIEIEFTGDEINRMLRNGDAIRRKKGKLRVISRAQTVITTLVAAGVAVTVWSSVRMHGTHFFHPRETHYIHASDDRFPTDLYRKIGGGGGFVGGRGVTDAQA